MKKYEIICADCPCLVEMDKKWFCDEIGQFCEDVAKCPEGVTLEEVEKMNAIKTPKLVVSSGEKKERKPRERKPNEDKRFIIYLIKEAILNGLEVSTDVVNIEREVCFTFKDKNYSITLTEHRPKKK